MKERWNIAKAFTKLPKAVTRRPWYGDCVAKALYIDLLCHTGFRDEYVSGVMVPEGWAGRSVEDILKDNGIGRSQYKRARQILIKSGDLTTVKKKKFNLYKVRVDFDAPLPTTDKPTETPTDIPTDTPTDKPPDSIQYIRRMKNVEEREEGGRREKEAKTPSPKDKKTFSFFNNVRLTEGEMASLIAMFPDMNVKAEIERFGAYMARERKDYPDHYIRLIGWIAEDEKMRKTFEPERAEKKKTEGYAPSYDLDIYVDECVNGDIKYVPRKKKKEEG